MCSDIMSLQPWEDKCALSLGVELNEDGSIRDGTFRKLFVWLYEQDVTMGVFKPMLAWAQAEKMQ